MPQLSLFDCEKRWRGRRERWVTPSDCFQPTGYAVDGLAEARARTFIEREHARESSSSSTRAGDFDRNPVGATSFPKPHRMWGIAQSVDPMRIGIRRRGAYSTTSSSAPVSAPRRAFTTPCPPWACMRSHAPPKWSPKAKRPHTSSCRAAPVSPLWKT